jgi:hypothetical protein
MKRQIEINEKKTLKKCEGVGGSNVMVLGVLVRWRSNAMALGFFNAMALQHNGVAGCHSNAMALGVLARWCSNTMLFQCDGVVRCFDYLDIELIFKFLRIKDLSFSFCCCLGFLVPTITLNVVMILELQVPISLTFKFFLP